MREIKFRAWDSVSKGWTDGHYPIGQHISDTEFGYDTESGRYILCQYTGLKDKNGKEIYEGDILAVKDWGIREETSQVLGNAQIVWDTQECGWRITPTLYIEDTYDLLGKAIPKSEVIGNIYENPELLSDKPE